MSNTPKKTVYDSIRDGMADDRRKAALYDGLLEENRILREALFPRPEIEGTAPLILYFGTDKDRDEFLALVRQAMPNMKGYKV